MSSPPSSSSKGLVLITGFNGYLAGWVADAVLRAGYHVRGSVRRPESATRLLEYLSDQGYGDRVEIVQTADFSQPGAFDAAVQGCTAILHLASPVGAAALASEPKAVYEKAVAGTRAVFEAALKEEEKANNNGPQQQLESLVVMSSLVTVLGEEPRVTRTERDWNTSCEAAYARDGPDTHIFAAYVASKTAAERALWEMREERKPGFAVSSIQGSWFIGPPLIPWERREDIMVSLSPIWNTMSGEGLPPPMAFFQDTIDVRDVARVIAWAAMHPREADGQRFICSSANGGHQGAADIMARLMPDLPLRLQDPEPMDFPGYVAGDKSVVYDSSKAVRATGEQWIDFQTSVLDSAKFLRRYLD
ncbi:NAD(P)-binding protein [Xylariomycetidae sp. FL2044]|nr:NAD(P)-binding protein [Xylariomycetidae sp. FL2044]